MASCQTSRWVSTAPYVKLTVTQSSSSNSNVTLSWTLQYISDSAASTSVAKSYSVVIAGSTVNSGTFNINGKTGTHTIASGTKIINKTTSTQTISFSCSFTFNLTWSGVYKGTLSASSSISVATLPSYTVRYYANGGTGVPSNQTKWYGKTLTLSSSKPTRTGYSFKGWGTSATATTVAYASGANYTSNSAINLYALWTANTYTVSYNANGGSGAPSSQTKIYGKTLTLSKTIPTRRKYTFKGWGTSASATTVAYAAGASYTANAKITLYAIWELAYVEPVIYGLEVYRCDSSGTFSETGTNMFLYFRWGTTNEVSSITVDYTDADGVSATDDILGNSTGTSGSIAVVIGNDSLSLDSTYKVTVYVSDDSGTTSASTALNSAEFAIDILAKGKGISFGKAAELEGVADFGWDAKFNKPVYGNVHGLNKLPEILANSDLNHYMETGSYAVYKNTNAETIANIPVNRAGTLIVKSSTGEGIRSEQWSYLRQIYIPYDMNYPTWERDISRNANNVWTYYDWYRTSLSNEVSDKVYHTSKVLWSGALYMTAGHHIDLSEPVSAQPNGIVLVFSKYDDTNGIGADNNFNSFFVPRAFVTSHYGYGNAFTMMDINFGMVCHKYLYINNDSISGHANNGSGGIGASGITYQNMKYVLRYVYGV